MANDLDTDSAQFGRLLRFWRSTRGLSQLDLAGMAQTTPRYISFLETGRSRPGRDVVLRLGRALGLRIRDINTLLTRAGLPTEFVERTLDDDMLRPHRTMIGAILDKHEPYPACVVDPVGSILLANRAFLALSPGAMEHSREASIDMMLDPNGPMPDLIENWEQVVWSWIDHQKAELLTTSNPRLAALVRRAEAHLSGMTRPSLTHPDSDAVISPRFIINGQKVSTLTTTMRFQHPTEVTLSEVRVQLMFPADDASRAFFEARAANEVPLP